MTINGMDFDDYMESLKNQKGVDHLEHVTGWSESGHCHNCYHDSSINGIFGDFKLRDGSLILNRDGKKAILIGRLIERKNGVRYCDGTQVEI